MEARISVNDLKKSNEENTLKKSNKMIKCPFPIFHISFLPSGNICLMTTGDNQFYICDTFHRNIIKTIPFPEKIDGFNQEQNGLYYHIALHEVTVFNPVKLNFDFKIKSESGTNYIMKPVLLNESEFVCFYSTMKKSTLRVYDFNKGPTPLIMLGPYQINQSAITQISPDSFAVCTPNETRFFKKKEGTYVNICTNLDNTIKSNMTALVRISSTCIAKLLYFQEYLAEVESKTNIKTLPSGKCSIQIWEKIEEKWNCTSVTAGDMPYWPEKFQVSPDGSTLIGIISTNNDKKLWAWDIVKKKARTYHFEKLAIDFETLLLLPNGAALYAQKKNPTKLVIFDKFVTDLQKNMNISPGTSGVFGSRDKDMATTSILENPAPNNPNVAKNLSGAS